MFYLEPSHFISFLSIQSPFRILLQLDENIASNWDLYLITILTLLLGMVIYLRRPPAPEPLPNQPRAEQHNPPPQQPPPQQPPPQVQPSTPPSQTPNPTTSQTPAGTQQSQAGNVDNVAPAGQ